MCGVPGVLCFEFRLELRSQFKWLRAPHAGGWNEYGRFAADDMIGYEARTNLVESET